MKHYLTLLFFIFSISLYANKPIEFSTAGFFTLPNSGRTVENMNPAWRFHKGDVEGAESFDFNDSEWDVVSLPNGLEYLPVEASGGKNYRGEVWYRKHFDIDANQYQGKRLVLHFEAIMGKSKVWVNGTQVAEHFGGFLPIAIDITDNVKLGDKNIISVWADNSDDPAYPPGKSQGVLDFCYFGGIYRDCWLISTSKTYITDPNMIDMVADGGLLVHYTNVSEKQATVNLKLNLQNEQSKSINGNIEFILDQGITKSVKYSLAKSENKSFSGAVTITNPRLWSPENPNLYDMQIIVRDSKGNIIDGYRRKIGIRSIEFTHEKGFILNGMEYPRKLIGANRHQDFAVIGNALSNNLHWRDAEKLKLAGMEIIRNAHYPQDPAFMDACDELGLFIISNTPGWQFWNDDPIFEQRVYSDIRGIIRRDRNSPSVIMWEPILNETWYPEPFAANVHNIVKEEFPYSPNYTSSDSEALGSKNFDVIFAHPSVGDAEFSAKHVDPNKVYFTREFGDNVDDWNSHNSPSRVSREWGEIPMLVQAEGYASPYYKHTSIDALYRAPRYHVGGTLWHSFDHQRGYHPDPFYGGVMTAFRRAKYSYYMFQSQAPWTQPMVYIANEMTPFSPSDVTVYSNCDEVRLHTVVGDTLRIYKRKTIDPLGGEGLLSPIITFKDAFDVMKDKNLARTGRHSESYLLAEGYNNGKLVASHKVMPARRPSKIELIIDTLSASPVADGGDLVVVVAQMKDGAGNIKRLNNEWILFEVTGEARVIGDEATQSNPAPIEWGEAPLILQTTTRPGKVTVKASVQFPGENTPVSGSIEFNTIKPTYRLIYSKSEAEEIGARVIKQQIKAEPTQAERAATEARLKEVERQQKEFGE